MEMTPVNGAWALALVIVKPDGTVSDSDLMTELPVDKLLNVAVIEPLAAIAESVTLNCFVAAKPGNANAANVIATRKQSILRRLFMEVSLMAAPLDAGASSRASRSVNEQYRRNARRKP